MRKRQRSRSQTLAQPSSGRGPAKIREVIWRTVKTVRPAEFNARTHSTKQVAQLAAVIQRFGFTNPILIDEYGVVIAGHARLEAAKELELTTIPTITIVNLTPAQKRALALADNRIAQNAGWDEERLTIELKELSVEVDFDLEILGFTTTEIDLRLDPPTAAGGEHDIPPKPETTSVSIVGDVWNCGKHRLAVGDVRDKRVLRRLMDGGKADAVFTDAPFNVPVDGHVRGQGRTKHREFAMASGEMTEEEFEAFLRTALTNLVAFSKDGAIHFLCMDWRHIELLLRVGRSIYSALKNLVVWVKTNAGLGSFYRSHHELLAVFKVGTKPHQNNFGLGQDGRWRSNVWTYAGSNAFQARRKQELDLHPTVKPIALVADAIKDVTRRNQIVLDGFAGSGTTLIAAEKTGRIARVVEIDPLYADVIVRRWQVLTGEQAHHAETGLSFKKIAARRSAPRAKR